MFDWFVILNLIQYPTSAELSDRRSEKTPPFETS